MPTRWEKREAGEGRKPVQGRPLTGYVESQSKGVNKQTVQQWCYLCNTPHAYHLPKR